MVEIFCNEVDFEVARVEDDVVNRFHSLQSHTTFLHILCTLTSPVQHLLIVYIQVRIQRGCMGCGIFSKIRAILGQILSKN